MISNDLSNYLSFSYPFFGPPGNDRSKTWRGLRYQLNLCISFTPWFPPDLGLMNTRSGLMCENGTCLTTKGHGACERCRLPDELLLRRRRTEDLKEFCEETQTVFFYSMEKMKSEQGSRIQFIKAKLKGQHFWSRRQTHLLQSKSSSEDETVPGTRYRIFSFINILILHIHAHMYEYATCMVYKLYIFLKLWLIYLCVMEAYYAIKWGENSLFMHESLSAEFSRYYPFMLKTSVIIPLRLLCQSVAIWSEHNTIDGITIQCIMNKMKETEILKCRFSFNLL